NHDGELTPDELRLDSQPKVVLIKERLRDAGVRNPRIHGHIRAYHIHHNVRHGKYVSRQCVVCHPENPDDLPPFDMAPYLPNMVKPVLHGDSTAITLDGQWRTTWEGRLQFAPADGVAQSWQMIENTIRSEP
ncbi:MAG: hypothetical protein ACR2O5_01910, partial [Thiogranum sp.]